MHFFSYLSLLFAVATSAHSYNPFPHTPHLLNRVDQYPTANGTISTASKYIRGMAKRVHVGVPSGAAVAMEKQRLKRSEIVELEERGGDDDCDDDEEEEDTTLGVQGTCFPALTAKDTPALPAGKATPKKLAKWWCPDETEYAYMGFSYDVSGCLSRADLTRDFKWMKEAKNARYVRMYGACDDPNFNDAIVFAAADAGLGIYALIWFGFDGDDKWKSRMNSWIKTIRHNRLAPYVVKNIAVGSEPLFDWVLTPDQLAAQLTFLRRRLKKIGVPVTISEMPWGFQQHGNTPQVFRAMQSVSLNVLPFFDSAATVASKAWGVVSWSIAYAKKHGGGKKVTITQTGWPSNTNVWKANSKSAIASKSEEQAYYDLLDSQCSYFKHQNVGWFSHIFDDDTLPGWGVLTGEGQDKFKFAPRTHC